MSIRDGLPTFLNQQDILYNAPKSVKQAALAYALIFPTPAEVWNHLPPSIIYDKIIDFRDYRSQNTPDIAHSNFDFSQIRGKLTQAPEFDRAVRILNDVILPTSGRAGGKVNLRLSQVLVRHILTPLGVEMVRYLAWRYLAKSLHYSFESTQIISLVLLDQFSAVSGLVTELLIMCGDRVFSEGISAFTKLCKEIHSCSRLQRTFPGQPTGYDDEFTRLAYGIDTIAGRSEHLKIDIPAEIRMRTRDNTIRQIPTVRDKLEWSNSASYDAELATCIALAVDETHEPRVTSNLQTFSDWYAKRMGWAAAGGAPGAKINWGAGAKVQRLNKRGAMLVIPEGHYRRILEDACPPALWSKCAPKYENGKMRAIWNTSIEFYVIQAYVSDMFETNATGHAWHTAKHSISEKVKHDLLRIEALEKSTGFMWDFSDFNLNHTHRSMAMLGDEKKRHCLRNLDRSRHLYEPEVAAQIEADVNIAVDWATAAHNIVFQEDPATGFIANTIRSLLSGERDTSLVNTYLNRAYTIMVDRWCKKNLGRILHRGHSYHQGDDAFFSVDSPYDGALLAVVFNLLGFAGQAYKITNNYGGTGEFLRYSYSGGTKRIGGYPIRSAMGIINGEFHREYTGDPTKRLAAFLDQYAKLRRRGSNLTSKLAPLILANIAPLTYTTTQEVKKVDIPVDLITLPARFGGYGISYTDPTLTGTTNMLVQAAQSEHITWKEAFKCMQPGRLVVKSQDILEHAMGAYGELVQRTEKLSPLGLTLQIVADPDDPHAITCIRDLERSLVSHFNNVFRHVATLRGHIFASDITISYYDRPPPPAYKPYRVDAAVFMGSGANKKLGHKRVLADFEAARKYSVTDGKPIRMMRDLIAESALTGAYDPSHVSESLANYAKIMDVYLRRPARKMTYNIDTGRTERIHRYINSLFEQFGPAPLDLDELQIHTKNSYGIGSALASVLGFSLTNTMKVVIENLDPLHVPGYPGRILRLLSQGNPAQVTAIVPSWLLSNLTSHHSSMRELAAKYLMGELDFMPPPPTMVGTNMISLLRNYNLQYIERTQLPLTLEITELQDDMYLYDTIATLFAPCLLSTMRQRLLIISD